jgi:caspase domain-containing protein
LAAFIAVGGAGSEIDHARALLGSLDRERDIRALINRGRSYALIIGNKDYDDPKFTRLETPHEDARTLANVLTTRYGFTTELILGDGSVRSLILLDRPARELNSLLDDLEESMTIDDRLLIFYAGHGHLDESTRKAYWIPVEAHKGRRSEFISADSIVSALRGIKARSVLVVADSCFSGALFRGASSGSDPSEEELANSLAKDAERSSRVLIASGGTEPVLDGGGSGHSIFMRKLLDALADPIRPIFSARELHVRRLQPSVSGNVKQVPQYDWLRESGHDAGDFVFVQAAPATASK